MSIHFFDTELASRLGVDAAIVFWMFSTSHPDSPTWTLDGLCKMMPYMQRSEIFDALMLLQQDGILRQACTV